MKTERELDALLCKLRAARSPGGQHGVDVADAVLARIEERSSRPRPVLLAGTVGLMMGVALLIGRNVAERHWHSVPPPFAPGESLFASPHL